MPLSLHSGKNIFMGNNALQEQHFENNHVSFSFSSVSHRLVSVCRHRNNSPQFTSRSVLWSSVKKSTPILLYSTTEWLHILGSCPSSTLSTRNCNTPVVHRATGKPRSLPKMFYFNPSHLQFTSAQSVFSGCPSSFHAHLASPPLSVVFPMECILPVPPSHSGLPLCSVLLCIFLFTNLLCFPHMFAVMAPEIPSKSCTALCWQRDSVLWHKATLGQTALFPPVHRQQGGCRLLQTAAWEQHIHSSVVHWSPVH